MGAGGHGGKAGVPGVNVGGDARPTSDPDVHGWVNGVCEFCGQTIDEATPECPGEPKAEDYA